MTEGKRSSTEACRPLWAGYLRSTSAQGPH